MVYAGLNGKQRLMQEHMGKDVHTVREKVLIGFNDFATRNPELLEEWAYENNKEIMPYNVMPSSHKMVCMDMQEL